jgi:hypothetical protein
MTVTWHHTVDLIVTERVAAVWTLVLAWKSSATLSVATSMNLIPIGRILNPDLTVVCCTFEWEIVPDTALLTTLDLSVMLAKTHLSISERAGLPGLLSLCT